jgi:hypothetical protein
MTEASNSSPSLSLAGDSLDSSSPAVDLFPQYPESRIGDDADTWMPPFREFEELPCPWDEYETTKEIYEQSSFHHCLGSEFGVISLSQVEGMY